MDDRSDRRDRPVGTPDDHFVWPPPIDAGDAGTDSEPQASSDEDLPEAYLPPPPPPAGALWPGYLDALPPAEISEPIRDVKAPEVAVADVAEGFPDAPSVIGASPSVIGRAAVRTASAERDEVQAWRSSGRTYRAGIAPADPPAAAAMPAPPAAAAMPAPPAAAQPQRPVFDGGRQVDHSGEGRPRTGADSAWAAFAQPWREVVPTPPRDAAPPPPPPPPAAAPPVIPAQRAEPRGGGRAAFWATASVPGSSPITAADVAAAVAMDAAAIRSRTYRGSAQSEPDPVRPPDPVEPPQPHEPPQPVEPPQPAEPPQPGPSPFPSPTPVPQPPAPPQPVPPPYPQPQPPAPPPGPPPIPPPPQPPGPDPAPPYPPPPPMGAPLPHRPRSPLSGDAPPPPVAPAPPVSPAVAPPTPPAPALPPWPQPTFPGSGAEPPYTIPSAHPMTPPTGGPATALAAPPAPPAPAPPAATAAFPPRDWRSTLVPPAGDAPAWQTSVRADPGTVYSGGKDLPEMTTALASGWETSGSLTGHILAQGEVDAPRTKWRTGKVVLILFVVLAVLVLAGWAVASVAGDAVTDWFNGLIDS